MNIQDQLFGMWKTVVRSGRCFYRLGCSQDNDLAVWATAVASLEALHQVSGPHQDGGRKACCNAQAEEFWRDRRDRQGMRL